MTSVDASPTDVLWRRCSCPEFPFVLLRYCLTLRCRAGSKMLDCSPRAHRGPVIGGRRKSLTPAAASCSPTSPAPRTARSRR